MASNAAVDMNKVRELHPAPAPEIIEDPEQRRAADAALVAALRTGHPGAPAKLFDEYGRYVERLLLRILGSDPELDDVLHETFAHAFGRIDKLRDPSALRSWLTRIAVCQARDLIRSRSRKRWLRFVGGEELDQVAGNGASPSDVQAVKRIYQILDRIPAKERIPFVLRKIDGMTLPETAEACDCSLATTKRRIQRAQERLEKMVHRDPLMSEWLTDWRGGAA